MIGSFLYCRPTAQYLIASVRPFAAIVRIVVVALLLLQGCSAEENVSTAVVSTTDGHKTGYNQVADAKFRSLLDAVDRLRDVLDGIDGDDFSLPAIAVIGAQSSGKSSILERLSGVDLPRGEGMVTRCGKEI